MFGANRRVLRYARERREDSASPRVVLCLLALLSVWAVVYELTETVVPGWVNAWPFTGTRPDVVFGVAGALVIARGIWRSEERGWIFIGLGAVCWATGDVYFNTNLAQLSSPPVPSWADAGYLCFCPLSIAGIVALVRGRFRGAPRTLVADAAAAALAVGALSATFVARQVLAHAKGGTWAVATNLAYPIVDLLLLALLVGVVALRNWKIERLWLLLGAGVVSFWIADSLYLITVASNSYSNSAWFNALWWFAPVFFGWAAWLPHASQRRPAAATASGGARGVMIPLGFACVALGLLVWSSVHPIGVIAIVLCTLSLLVVMARLVLTWRENAALLRSSRSEALTDSLTGLANRRALTVELERRTLHPEAYGAYTLALFDLDGFKHYNDSFGHPAGDALLQRLGLRLATQVKEWGTAYRMGGDEFCILTDRPDPSGLCVQSAARSLSDHGEGFSIGCSYGHVVMPSEAEDPSEALRVADQRMYAHKHAARPSASRQSSDVLVRALVERDPDLGHHVKDVAVLATATARRLGMPESDVEQIRQAAELHDVGKVAIPDAILEKPGALDDEEWEFIRRHTLIGERILAAAPALQNVAALVRSSHENYDGTGYPDGLKGIQIPVGSRVIAVCDAFHAMTTDRAYRKAMAEEEAVAELRRCSAGQFDPVVVEAFCQVLSRSAKLARAA